MDIVGRLPPEIAQHILLYLGPDDIDTIWNHIEEWKHLYDGSFWKKVCLRNGYDAEEYCLSSNFYRRHMLQCSDHWQAIYKYYRLIDSNWRHGNFKCISFAKEKKYDEIHYLDDEMLVVSSIKFISNVTTESTDIINLSTGKIYFSFDISCSALYEEKLVRKIASHGNLLIFLVYTKLKVLNLKTKSWILNVSVDGIEGFFHEPHLIISNNLLAYVNARQRLYVVNLKTKEVHFETSVVTSVSFGDKIIVVISGSNSNNLRVLDLDCKTLMSIDYGDKSPLDYALTKGGYVIIFYPKIPGVNTEKISVYTIQQDTKSLQEINSVYASYSTMYSTDNETLMLCSREMRMKGTYSLWKFATEDHPTTFSTNRRGLQLTLSNNNYLFLLDEFCTLDMWSRTGQFIKILSDEILTKATSGFQVTDRKLAFLNCDRSICVQDYDIEVSA